MRNRFKPPGISNRGDSGTVGIRTNLIFHPIFHLKHFLVVWRNGRQIVFQIQPDADVMTGVLREADERMAREPTRVVPREDPVPRQVRRLRGQLRTCVRDLKLGGTEFLLCSKVEDQPAEYAYAIHVSQRSARADIAAWIERMI